MTIPGFDFSEGPVVEMWSAKRLPYGPKDGSTAKAARDRLRAALERMVHDESQVLYASYTSSKGGRPFDIENVLAYNVGMAAFARTGQRGMCFERIWAEPPSKQPGLSFDHHHTYRLAAPPSRPPEGVSLTVDLQEPDLKSVARVWWAVSGAAAAGANVQPSRPITGRFALHVEIGMVGLAKLHQVIKVLLDGLVAGLQADSDPNPEAVGRLSRCLSRPAADVAARLLHPTSHLIHTDGRLVLPYRKNSQGSLQWHPADHRCESIAVIVTGPPGCCRLTITELGDHQHEAAQDSASEKPHGFNFFASKVQG